MWVIRDFGTAEWFHSLLHAIEEQDAEGRIDISIYLTAKLKEDEMNNILVRRPLGLSNGGCSTRSFTLVLGARRRS